MAWLLAMLLLLAAAASSDNAVGTTGAPVGMDGALSDMPDPDGGPFPPPPPEPTTNP